MAHDMLRIHVPGEIRGKGQRGSSMKATDDQVRDAYATTGSVWKAASQLGMCGQSVHERLVKMGLSTPVNVFTDVERDILREQYQDAANAGQLAGLAAAMGRTKPFIARQARVLGLTDRGRQRKYLAGVASLAMREWYRINEHPRGMLGKKHSAEVGLAIAKAGRDRWAAMTDDERDAAVLKRIKAKAAKNDGKVSAGTGENGRSWKAAWREIGGQRCYFRSRWEANYARYLQTLVEASEILSWEHEPKAFWFEGIRRGSMSYLPDFRVVDTAGNVTFHEVKGWMDERSTTKLARMAKYFPEVAMVVIDSVSYKKLRALLAHVVPDWET